MKKVVINDCFGGFGLSLKAEEEYLKLCGKECHFYKRIGYASQGEEVKHIRVSIAEAEQEFVSHTLTKDFGDSFEEFGDEQNDCYFSDRDIARDDPDLVAVVEKLGEEAFGNYASLKVVEIPDDVKWFIDEYDGAEHIAEEHRTWS